MEEFLEPLSYSVVDAGSEKPAGNPHCDLARPTAFAQQEQNPMMKHVALAAVLAACATPAAAQQMQHHGMSGHQGMTTTRQVVVQPGAAPMRMDRETFRMMAMMSDGFEIASSRLAMERSRNPRVLAYAQQMIRDHSMTSQALNGGRAVYAETGDLVTGSIAGSAVGAGVGFLAGGPVGAAVGAGVGATTGSVAAAPIRTAVPLDAEKVGMLNQLAAADGRQFDRLYGRMQAASHQQALALFTSYAQAGDDPAMRAFAQQTIPHLEMHYSQARRLPR
jgi:predicted outer membrane protein